MRTTRRWTTYDEEYLLDNYGSMKMTTLCKKLDRTDRAIKDKYGKLTKSTSIRNTTELLNSNTILEFLGVLPNTLRNWRNNYGFPYTRLSNKPNGNLYYHQDKVFDWLLLNKDRVDFSKCTLGLLIDEPSWFIKLVTKSEAKSVRWTLSEIKSLIEMDMNNIPPRKIGEALNKSGMKVSDKLYNIRKNGDYDYYKDVLLK